MIGDDEEEWPDADPDNSPHVVFGGLDDDGTLRLAPLDPAEFVPAYGEEPPAIFLGKPVVWMTPRFI